MKPSEMIRELKRLGFTLWRPGTKHDAYRHPSGELFTVSHGTKMSWFYRQKLNAVRRKLERAGYVMA